jgi:hypothetical protein
MRLIHRVPFSSQEVESFRQLIFNNLTHGLKYVLDSMEDMQLVVSPENKGHIELIESANDLRDGEVFPPHFYEPLYQLWNDRGVQQAWERGNEAALPEKYTSFFFSYFCGNSTVPVKVWRISSLIWIDYFDQNTFPPNRTLCAAAQGQSASPKLFSNSETMRC